jgi:hypothetical protein
MSKYKQMLLDEQAAIQEYLNKVTEFDKLGLDHGLNEDERYWFHTQQHVMTNKLYDIEEQLWFVDMIDSKLF